jgi:probable F420-dependent oxidoreductase
VKLGVNLPQTTTYDLAHDVTAFAREAERIGYDSLWAFERLLSPIDQSGPHGLYGRPDVPWPDYYGYTADPLVTLAMAAAVTERAELGTGVLVPPLHLPVRLAKTLASLDAASGGRLIAGLGSGWSVDEFTATAPRPREERGDALDEFLDVAAAIWGDDPVAFDTGRYRVAPARVNPKPARPVPIFLAARGEPALRRLARRADGWLPTAIEPAEVAATLTRLREMAGRDIRCVVQVHVRDLSDLGPVADQVKAHHDAGAEHVYVTLPSVAGNLGELIEAAAELHAAVR